MAPLLGTVLEQLSNGGGAKSVSVESVGEEVEELGRQYPIVIPAYFGLIIRYANRSLRLKESLQIFVVRGTGRKTT